MMPPYSDAEVLEVVAMGGDDALVAVLLLLRRLGPWDLRTPAYDVEVAEGVPLFQLDAVDRVDGLVERAVLAGSRRGVDIVGLADALVASGV